MFQSVAFKRFELMHSFPDTSITIRFLDTLRLTTTHRVIASARVGVSKIFFQNCGIFVISRALPVLSDSTRVGQRALNKADTRPPSRALRCVGE